MIVNGITWTHPATGHGYYAGFNPCVLTANVGDIELVASLHHTDAYETYWTVTATRDGEQLFKVNFIRKETALIGAAALLGAM